MLKESLVGFLRSRRVYLTLSVCLAIPVVIYILLYRQQQQQQPKTRVHYSGSSSLLKSRHCINSKTSTNFKAFLFYTMDLVAKNQYVNKLSSVLQTSTEVIDGANRIQMNMFQRIIGKYKFAMLFNIAENENKGNSAVISGTVLLLQRLNIELLFFLEDSRKWEASIHYAQELSKNYSAENLVILLQSHENVMHSTDYIYQQEVLRAFMTFKVVVFPQNYKTIQMKDKEIDFKEIYALHPRLTLLYRDKFSYQRGKDLFTKARALLMPDIAFQIGKVTRFMFPVHDILWMVRSDKKSTQIRLPEKARDYDIITEDWRDWATPHDNGAIENGFLSAANGMIFLQRGRVIITDSLHGHILSVLLDIPHVVLDNDEYNVSDYRNTWTKGLENVVFAYTQDDALFKALWLLEKHKDEMPQIASFRKSIEYDAKVHGYVPWYKKTFAFVLGQ